MQRVAWFSKSVQQYIKYSGWFSTFLKIRAFCCIANEKYKFTGHLWKSWLKPEECLKIVSIWNLFSSFIVLPFLTSALPLRRTSKNISKAVWWIMQISPVGYRYKFPVKPSHLHCTLGISTALISVFPVKTRSCSLDVKLMKFSQLL